MPDLNAFEQKTNLKFFDIHSLSRGNAVELFKMTTEEGASLFLKYGKGGQAGLDLEGWMLHRLEQAGLPVPHVHFYDGDHLLLDFIEGGGSLGMKREEQAARHLAELHLQPQPFYGLERDTIIGALPQPNPKEGNWPRFFGEHRIRYSADKAYEERRISAELHKKLNSLADNIENYLDEPPHPSLVHGDMWGGNQMMDARGQVTFMDPAIYYADSETEIAFTFMFNAFSRRFVQAYEEITPLREGFWERRLPLYNLYPLLVHVRLFGGPYVRGVEENLRKINW